MPCRKKNSWPIHLLPVPNMNAKPNAQNNSAHKQVSAMHEIMTFDTSRVLANPASKNMNPACMKNTRNAVTNTQTVLIGLTKSLAWCCTAPVAAPAAESKYQLTPFIAASRRTTAVIFPARMTPISLRRSFSLSRFRRVIMDRT